MPFSRRTFLARGGGATIGLVGASLGSARWLQRAAAATSGFNAQRRRVYRSVVTALGRARSTLVDPSRADEAVAEFETWYDAAGDDQRRTVDSVLDALEADARFSELSERDRYAYLRATVGSSEEIARSRDHNGRTFEEHLAYENRRIERIWRSMSSADRAKMELDPAQGYLQTYEGPPDPSQRFDREPFPNDREVDRKRRERASVAIGLAQAPFEPEPPADGPKPPVDL